VNGLWSAGPGGFLGLNYSGMHDSSVCLYTADGELVYAVTEERFSRVKQDGRFPRQALATIDLTGLAAVGVPYLAASPEPPAPEPVFDALLLPAAHRPVLAYPPVWHERLASLGLPVMHFDHHEMHAYTGYVLSGYEEALVLTGDYGAYACSVTMGVFHVSRGKITRLAGASVSDHEALAGMYTDVTTLLGFTPCKHEGKITGLAAQGRPDQACRRDLWQLHQQIRSAQHRLYDWVGFLDETVPPFYEPNTHLVAAYRAQLPYSDADLARAAQDLLEDKLRDLATWIGDTHGRTLPLVVSGGLFANVRANLELARLGFAKLFVTPPMGDDGLSLGAAAAACQASTCPTDPRPQPPPQSTPTAEPYPASMALGPTPGDDHDSLLTELAIAFHRPPDPADDLARRVAAGQVVALVRGRQEFGPRALGQRSILCGATDPGINDRLNAKLRRTEFMPFAPVLRAERLTDVFDLDGLGDVNDCLPFMTLCLPVKDWVAAVAPAVVHLDGTARPQVVTEHADPFLYRLLTAYEQRTGIPVMINTSFNLHDEPLVSGANDALAAFFLAELDALCLEGTVIELAANQHVARHVDLTRRSGRDVAKQRHRALNRSFGRQIVTGPGRFSKLSDTTTPPTTAGSTDAGPRTGTLASDGAPPLSPVFSARVRELPGSSDDGRADAPPIGTRDRHPTRAASAGEQETT
jgi:carbamoyltransferase